MHRIWYAPGNDEHFANHLSYVAKFGFRHSCSWHKNSRAQINLTTLVRYDSLFHIETTCYVRKSEIFIVWTASCDCWPAKRAKNVLSKLNNAIFYRPTLEWLLGPRKEHLLLRKTVFSLQTLLQYEEVGFFSCDEYTRSTVGGSYRNSSLYCHILECRWHKLSIKTLIYGLELSDFPQGQIRENQIENATSLDRLFEVYPTIADLNLSYLRCAILWLHLGRCCIVKFRVIFIAIWFRIIIILIGYIFDCICVSYSWSILHDARSILRCHAETFPRQTCHILGPLRWTFLVFLGNLNVHISFAFSFLFLNSNSESKRLLRVRW